MRLYNTAEGGTSGTGVTTGNSGGLSGNAVDLVTTPTGGSLTYDTTAAIHGSLGFTHSIGVTAGECYYWWAASMGSLGAARAGCSFLVAANPGTVHKLISFLSGATVAGRVNLGVSGKVQAIDSAGTTVATSTSSVPLGTGFRVELDVVHGATTGMLAVRLYAAADDLVPLETLGPFTAQNAGTGLIDRVRFGPTGTTVANITLKSDDPFVQSLPTREAEQPGSPVWRARWRRPQVEQAPPAPAILPGMATLAADTALTAPAVQLAPATLLAAAALTGTATEAPAGPALAATTTVVAPAVIQLAPAALTALAALTAPATELAPAALAALAALAAPLSTVRAPAALTAAGTLTAPGAVQQAIAILAAATAASAPAALRAPATLTALTAVSAAAVQGAPAVLSAGLTVAGPVPALKAPATLTAATGVSEVEAQQALAALSAAFTVSAPVAGQAATALLAALAALTAAASQDAAATLTAVAAVAAAGVVTVPVTHGTAQAGQMTLPSAAAGQPLAPQARGATVPLPRAAAGQATGARSRQGQMGLAHAEGGQWP